MTIAFIFPGQGSQEVGMGQALAEAYPQARDIFAEADDILGMSLSRLCFEGPEAELNDTLNTQPALFVTSLATWQALRAAGYEPAPAYVAGHSLGEFSAYAAAGALSFADGLRLVRERGRLMKKAGTLRPGSMAAILKLDDETVLRICREVAEAGYGTIQVANFNSPGQVVISGEEAAIEQAMEAALAAGARKAVKLAVSVASHSELMRDIVAEFRQAIDNTPLNLPETPIVANINAEPLQTVEAIRAEMEGQLTASVHWTDSVRWMVAQGVTEFVEIGPKDVLTGLIRRITKQVARTNIRTPAEIEEFVTRRNHV